LNTDSYCITKIKVWLLASNWWNFHTCVVVIVILINRFCLRI
jgi:hypothetical protein